jgi:DNA polymerase-3 subunit alpha/error-prone DNA polymerase
LRLADGHYQNPGGAARNRSLFETPSADDRIPRMPPDDPRERLRPEFALFGFLCDRHPMELYVDAVHRACAVKAIDISRRVGRRVRFAGWLITGKVVETKRGEHLCAINDLSRPYNFS